MRYVGDALGDTLVQSKSNIVTIGIAPWGAVHKNEDLLGHGVSCYLFVLSLLIIISFYFKNDMPHCPDIVTSCIRFLHHSVEFEITDKLRNFLRL